MLSARSRIFRSPQILCQEMDGEAVMMSIDNGEYYHLDAIGTEIWKLIGEPVEVEALCRELSQRYDAGIDEISRDVLALAEQLAAKDLIIVHEA